jgi:hypothetical protein
MASEEHHEQARAADALGLAAQSLKAWTLRNARIARIQKQQKIFGGSV